MGGGRINLIDLFYPVGSYYETSDRNFNPNVVWGGTWVEDTQGYVTVGAGSDSTAPITLSVGSKTGSANHSITTSEMPSHKHTFTGTSHSHSIDLTTDSTSVSHSHSYTHASTTTGSHTLTTSEMPSHTHKFNNSYGDNQGTFNDIIGRQTGDYQGILYGHAAVVATCENRQAYYGITIASTGGGSGHTHSISLNSTTTGAQSIAHTHDLSGTTTSSAASGTISNTGSGNAMSLVQPSIGVIRWHRTA